MKVILTQNVPHLGSLGDEVSVKNGYARNFLLPRKLALLATKDNIKQREHHLRLISQTQQKQVRGAQALANRLNEVMIRLEAQAGEAGRLHGTVTAADVAEALASQHHLEVDRHAISFAEPIKVLGAHQAKVRFHKDVEATLKLEVVARAEEG